MWVIRLTSLERNKIIWNSTHTDWSIFNIFIEIEFATNTKSTSFAFEERWDAWSPTGKTSSFDRPSQELVCLLNFIDGYYPRRSFLKFIILWIFLIDWVTNIFMFYLTKDHFFFEFSSMVTMIRACSSIPVILTIQIQEEVSWQFYRSLNILGELVGKLVKVWILIWLFIHVIWGILLLMKALKLCYWK